MVSPQGLVLLMAVLPVLDSSLVQLKNNGYEGILIAINPNIPEDNNIIKNIKAMLTNASIYLFNSTRRRAFIRTVNILVPITWSAKSSYSRARTESYETADVIVADPFGKYGNDPYTLQYGGCGDPGRYIHFTPKFLLDDTLLKAYGPRGRVFVHEWSHLRWGVFDEYNLERPFYITVDKQVEATRCTKEITGGYHVREGRADSPTFRPCKIDAETQLYESGCLFYPSANQQATSSIMYMQAFTPVLDFCDKRFHNIEAPNLQNKMCNSRSTWEVILSSADFTNLVAMSGPDLPPPPSFSILQSGERVVCLVLDISGSMGTNNRIGREHEAAALFLLQIIELGSYAGIVTFDSSAYVNSELRHITTDVVRNELVNALPVSPQGGTDICAGLRMGFQVSANLTGTSSGAEIILLTDGEDNYDTSLCFPDVISSGAIVHVIALGPYASKALETIANMTGGQQFSATDNVDSNGLIDAFGSIISSGGNTSQQTIQLESTGLLLNGSHCLNGTVTIDNTVGNNTIFVVTWLGSSVLIRVEDPSGTVYTESDFVVSTVTKSTQLAIPGIAMSGVWTYSICNAQVQSQAVTITVISRAASPSVTPVTVDVHMNKDANQYPEPMVVYAQVSQGFYPVIGANVTAIIETQSGQQLILELLDNGAGADVVADDGVYSRFFFSFTENGRYSLKVRVEGKDGSSKAGNNSPGQGAIYIPGYVQENGTIDANPERPTVNASAAVSTTLESFSRTRSGGSFVVSNVPSGPLPDIFPPSRITDLTAQIIGNQTKLTWTATGGDLDQGRAASYDIRMSTDPAVLRDSFENATSVNASALSPLPAGSVESFTFTPENITITNGTILYFSVVAADASNLRSSPSNIAQAALLIPTPDPPTTTQPPSTAHPPTTSHSSAATHSPTSSDPPTTPPAPTSSHPPTTLNVTALLPTTLPATVHTLSSTPSPPTTLTFSTTLRPPTTHVFSTTLRPPTTLPFSTTPRPANTHTFSTTPSFIDIITSSFSPVHWHHQSLTVLSLVLLPLMLTLCC